jgi:hypothetical protein
MSTDLAQKGTNRELAPARPNIGIYSGGDPTSSSIGQLFAAIGAGSYSTVVLWAAHVDAAGDINMNDDPVIAGGRFSPAARPWAALVNGLRTNPVMTRVELSIGGDQSSFANIRALIAKYGTGPSNPLYVNLKALKQILNLDAVNYDDESEYDLNSSTQLALMCSSLGMTVSICPYTNQLYWIRLVSAINKSAPGTADGVYLQCYDGGAGSDPAQWNSAFQSTGLSVAPGLWATHQQGSPPVCTTSWTALQVQTQMASWAQQTSLAGGWMFCGTDMLNCPNGGTPAAYANAIRAGLGAPAAPQSGELSVHA